MPRTRKDADELLPEYDFSDAIQGKYLERYPRMGIQVILDADVANLFPNSAAVNQALRSYARMTIARSAKPKPARRKKAG